MWVCCAVVVVLCVCEVLRGGEDEEGRSCVAGAWLDAARAALLRRLRRRQLGQLAPRGSALARARATEARTRGPSNTWLPAPWRIGQAPRALSTATLQHKQQEAALCLTGGRQHEDLELHRQRAGGLRREGQQQRGGGGRDRREQSGRERPARPPGRRRRALRHSKSLREIASAVVPPRGGNGGGAAAGRPRSRRLGK